MSPRIGELLNVPPRPPLADPARIDLDAVRGSFVVTQETGEICARLFKRLAEPRERRMPYLFTGDRGVGKTHTLRFVEALLARPDAAEWDAVAAYFQEGTRPSAPMQSIYLALPPDPAVDLEPFLLENLEQEAFGSAAANGSPDSDPLGAASRQIGMIVFDDLSRRLERLQTPEATARDLRLVKLVVEKFAAAGIVPIVVMNERPRMPDGSPPDDASSLDPLIASCDFLWISRNNVRQVVTRLSTRTDAQSGSIYAALEGLRQRLPSIGAKIDSFAELYPLHPLVFELLFDARAAFPSFSPLEFVRSTLEAARDRSADELLTLDVLFEALDAELRASERHRPLMAAYDAFRFEVVPLLKPESRPRGEALLKGIVLLTAFGARPSVNKLAEALLVYDPAGMLASTSFASALLVEMEQKGGQYLVVEGDTFDRAYRLVDRAGSMATRGREIVEREELFPPELPRLLADWVRSRIEGWRPDVSDRYRNASQLVEAPLPGGGSPAGMVYFKSLADPLWSEDDAAALQEMPYVWVVLILSPFERFYELEGELRQLVRKLPRLAIWRPGSPSAEEAEHLRRAAAQLAARAPRALQAARIEKLAWSQAQMMIEELLETMYVGRGELWTKEGDRPVAEVAGSRGISEGLASFLTARAAQEPEPTGAARTSAATPGSEKARPWAALFIGCRTEDLPAADAERRVLEWWSEIEKTLLPARLRTLPDSFLTSRFWKEIQAYERMRGLLALHFARLRHGDASFEEAMNQAARDFNGDPAKVAAWKDLHVRLSEILRWSGVLEAARDYLHSAVSSGQDRIEKLRQELVAETGSPHEFLDRAARKRFEERFAEFKKGYVDFYYAAHEDALNIVGNPERLETKVDYIALRNLELLSKLLYTDKSYLHRVRIQGEWIQVQQCQLPVRQILDQFPRCYCNFNPSTSKVASSVAGLNASIRDGIDYFRAILRKCNMIVIQELRAMRVDDYHSKQIASLLSQGAMIPLKPQSIEILNRIIQGHAADFLSEIRSYKAQS